MTWNPVPCQNDAVTFWLVRGGGKPGGQAWCHGHAPDTSTQVMFHLAQVDEDTFGVFLVHDC